MFHQATPLQLAAGPLLRIPVTVMAFGKGSFLTERFMMITCLTGAGWAGSLTGHAIVLTAPCLFGFTEAKPPVGIAIFTVKHWAPALGMGTTPVRFQLRPTLGVVFKAVKKGWAGLLCWAPQPLHFATPNLLRTRPQRERVEIAIRITALVLGLAAPSPLLLWPPLRILQVALKLIAWLITCSAGLMFVRSTRASLEWTTSLHPLCRNSIQSSYSRSTTPALSATSSLLCHSQTGLLLPHPAWLMSLMSLMLCSPAGGCHSTTAVCSGTSPLWSLRNRRVGTLVRDGQRCRTHYETYSTKWPAHSSIPMSNCWHQWRNHKHPCDRSKRWCLNSPESCWPHSLRLQQPSRPQPLWLHCHGLSHWRPTGCHCLCCSLHWQLSDLDRWGQNVGNTRISSTQTIRQHHCS